MTGQYCTGPDRNTTHIGILSTAGTDDVFLSNSSVEVVENFGSEAKIVGITSDNGREFRVCTDALKSKYIDDSVFITQSPLQHGLPCIYIGRGLKGGSAIYQVI